MQIDKKKNIFLKSAPYKFFAKYYDRLMDHVPYDSWARYLKRVADLHLSDPASAVLDLACGTGLLCEQIERLTSLEMYGIDQSPAMLKILASRLPQASGAQGDLGRCELPSEWPRKWNWVLCTHDSLNYLLDWQELRAHLRAVRRLLNPGALYSTDLVSEANLLHNFHNKNRTCVLPGGRLVWMNQYDKQNRILHSRLKFRLADGGLVEEHHQQRYHDPDEFIALAKDAGLRLLDRHGNYQLRAPIVSDDLWNFHFTV